MKLSDIVHAAQYRICGGTEYQWNCFGPNARFLEFCNITGLEVLDIVFDAKNQTVYEVSICPTEENPLEHFIWINPDYRDKLFEESKKRNVDFLKAYDNVIFVEITDDHEVLNKIKQVIEN
jgi:hypothetical protein